MRRAVLLTGHFPRQKRRGSMLWVSAHLQSSGWHVTHATVGYSWLGNLMGDKRLATLEHRPRPGQEEISPALTALYHLPLIHPFRSSFAAVNTLVEHLTPSFRHHWEPRLRKPLNDADLVICESGAPILLAPLLSRYGPQAARIYRVNDDLRLLNAPDVLLRAERDALRHVTRISTSSPHLARHFAAHPNVTLDPMGVPRALLSQPRPDPYIRKPHQRIAVCAGTTQLDLAAVTQIAQRKPDWQIHVLGRTQRNRPALPNLCFQGEVPYEQMLAHVAHADIGLAPYLDRPGVEYQINNSNRILLYRHYGLPILGPQRLCHLSVPTVYPYEQMDLCEAIPKRPERVPDWSDLAARLAQNSEIVPPEDATCSPASVV